MKMVRFFTYFLAFLVLWHARAPILKAESLDEINDSQETISDKTEIENWIEDHEFKRLSFSEVGQYAGDRRIFRFAVCENGKIAIVHHSTQKNGSVVGIYSSEGTLLYGYYYHLHMAIFHGR